MKNEMIIGLLLGTMAAGAFASESNGIYSFSTGSIQIHMLVERQNPGNPGILVGADESVLKQYIPSGAFTHSANVFLVKTPSHTILIDTGFGQTIFEKMKTLGVEPDQVDAVLLTHTHGDHVGGLVKDGKPVFGKAKIYLSALENEYAGAQGNRGAGAALSLYGDRVVTFTPREIGTAPEELLPGIFPIAGYGHTPGHTVFMIQNNGSRFIVAGDFLHVAPVQFPRPDISASYDMDKNNAAQFRANILKYAAENNIAIGGMHIVYPAAGRVEKSGTGFRFIPFN
jgi:glyoxylase-like metal-dependent hydrolase (beta-lactamase superfamily II)